VAGPIENDPFEEFEFKPLTEGLGFHSQGKKATPKAEVKMDSKVESRIDSKPDLKFEARREERRQEKSFVDDLLDLSTLETGKLDQPLLRTPLLKRPSAGSEIPAPTPTQPTKVDEVLKGLQKHNWDFQETGAARKSLKAQPEFAFRPSGYDVSAVVLDTMLVIAAFLGSLIILLMVTKVDLIAAVSTASTELLLVAFGSLIASICWIYLTVNRLFLGSTPGEWVFDQRLGPADAQGTARFAWKAILRATLILATGLVFFPLFSILLRRDLLGRWMGLELHQKSFQ